MATEIVQYSEKFNGYFKSLNVEWLNKYYSITAADLEILENPERIIQEGGYVFFAVLDDVVVGTCAIVPHEVHSCELIKMGVRENYQGKGIGKLLLEKVIEQAREKGFRTMTLETASTLEVAVSLYKKIGFVQTSPEEKHPKFGRMTFKMEMKL
ncbi:MAG: GNAT family N-acetyltransferase [Bacteroidetes bacterium]|nr:GNAT family N-acetyltransferase [Bacteroidota bacterium]MBL0139625.1 GNAT family N-acetyltransferase [Bacteroidota bacterium]